MTITPEIAAAVRIDLKAKVLTQRAIAEKHGIPKWAVHNIAAGRHPPKPSKFRWNGSRYGTKAPV